jgi:hypothetical protein
MNLNTRIHRFSAQRAALLDRLEGMTPAQLSASPRPGKWSILEIVEHLALAERAVLQGLPDPSRLSERQRSMKHRILYFLVVFVLKARIPVRVPSREMVPRGDRSLSQLRPLWDESQAWLQAYIDQLDSGGFRRAVFEHPVAGPLTVAQAVRLGQIHLDVHTRQINLLCR